MKRGHHSSGQLNVFVSLDDLHEAMEIKAKDRTKGSSARISKAMRDPQITNQGWQPCKNKKLGRGFVLSTDGGSDSGSDSPLVPILDWEPRTTPAQGIWGWFRSLEGKELTQRTTSHSALSINDPVKVESHKGKTAETNGNQEPAQIALVRTGCGTDSRMGTKPEAAWRALSWLCWSPKRPKK